MQPHVVDRVVLADHLFVLIRHRTALRTLHHQPDEGIDSVDRLFDGSGIRYGALDELDPVVLRRSKIENAKLVDFPEIGGDEGTDVSGTAD